MNADSGSPLIKEGEDVIWPGYPIQKSCLTGPRTLGPLFHFQPMIHDPWSIMVRTTVPTTTLVWKASTGPKGNRVARRIAFSPLSKTSQTESPFSLAAGQ